jgi:hypothetical protein
VLANISKIQRLWNALTSGVVVVSVLAAIPAVAQDSRSRDQDRFFWPGNLVVSRSVYDSNPNNVPVGEILPPNCASTQGGCSAATGAPFNGTYPFVWNNDTYDGSFGITSKIYLDQILPFGLLIDSLEVPNSSQRGITPSSDQTGHKFQFEIRIGSSSLHQRPVPYVWWLCSSDQPARCIEFQHSRSR